MVGIEAGGGSFSGCQAGDYKGTFQCLYQVLNSNADAGMDAGLLSFDVTGPVTLTLSQQQSGNGEDFLTVSGGTVSGDTLGGTITFTATMKGQLDCSTGMFMGELVDGKWSGSGPFAAFFKGTFTVSFDANYDAKNVQFTNGVTSGGCIGKWSAKYAGMSDGGALDSGPTDAGGGG